MTSETTGEPTFDTDLRPLLKTAWWLVLIRALLILAFGIITLASPGIALVALVVVFGVYAIMDGVTAISLAVRSRGTEKSWGWTAAQGAISVIAGIVALVWPGVTALSLLYVIAFWAIVLGVAGIAEGIRGRHTDDRWGWTIAKGALDIVFGILLLVWPATGILALLWLVGVFSVAGGLVLGVLAFRIRSLAKTV
ncbi:HdeD family acid-resistance protein [Pseudonocardia ailaonensis]|uniref:HdeD family acid-resistance protein n=1 Tax=Pseudonocardia ailaonensis TaxID=367279 RepID=A0ABN2NR14_9PSEU